jgi:phosphate transport system substrate-binding protein
MKSIKHLISTAGLSLAATLSVTFAAQAAEITGAGATFPAPVYAKWAEAYKAKTGNALNYQAIGSGGGIKQITAKTVDFGATDDPLSEAELTAGGLIQFPAVIGGIVPVINVPGVMPGQATMTGPTLAAVFSGQIKKWNDPARSSKRTRL